MLRLLAKLLLLLLLRPNGCPPLGCSVVNGDSSLPVVGSSSTTPAISPPSSAPTTKTADDVTLTSSASVSLDDVSSRDCLSPGCVCFRRTDSAVHDRRVSAQEDDGDDVTDAANDSTASDVDAAVPAGRHPSSSTTIRVEEPTSGPWRCTSLRQQQQNESRLRSIVDAMTSNGEIDTVVDLSITIDDRRSVDAVTPAPSSDADNSSATAPPPATDLLCRMKNVRRLNVTTADQDERDDDVATTNERGFVIDDVTRLVECFERLVELTVNGTTMTDASRLLQFLRERWLQARRRATNIDEEASSSSSTRLTGVSRLARVDLSNNLIRSFDVGITLMTSSSSVDGPEVLDLSGNLLTELTSTSCVWRQQVYPDQNETRNNVDDADRDVTAVIHSTGNGNGNCSRTPTRLFSDEQVSSLRSLLVSRNRIGRIDVGLFDFRFRDLETLDLSDNSLGLLANRTFSDLYGLRTINLSYNAISDIDVEAFATTSLLVMSSSLSDNETGTGSRPNERGQTAVDREEQYYIRLASCTSGWLDIEVVDLRYNRLTLIREGALELALCAVKHLLLSHNRLDRLPRYVFEHLPYLHTLDLADNQLAWLDVGAFTNPSLGVLDLSGNRLRKIVSMTFLYLPAIRRVDLSRNEITYVYKFAFYRMCSPDEVDGTVSSSTDDEDVVVDPGDVIGRVDSRDEKVGGGRQLEISLRENRLGSDAIWKMLTTFEHLESPGCRVAVDLRDNLIERFLPPEPLDFVRKRLDEASAASDPSSLSMAMQHFRRWDHVTVMLAGNRLRCDCALVDELGALDDVIRQLIVVANGSESSAASSSAGNDVFTKSWRRLNCSSPAEFDGTPVWRFVKAASARCRPPTPEIKLCPSYCACIKSPTESTDDRNASSIIMNCSGRHLTEFRVSLAAATSVGFSRIHVVDLSGNALVRVEPELLSRRWFPSLRFLYLHDNRLTSLPPTADGLLPRPIYITLAGNPFACSPCEQSTIHANQYHVSDWNRVVCSDGRHPVQMLAASGHACALASRGDVAGQRMSLSEGVTAAAVATVPKAFLVVGLTLAVVLVLLLVITLVGLVTWSTGEDSAVAGSRLRRPGCQHCSDHFGIGGCLSVARVGDLRLDGRISAAGGDDTAFQIDEDSGHQDLFVAYCGADAEWVAAHVLPVVRRCRSAFATVRLQSFDGRAELDSRQFLGDFRYNLDESCVTVVVVSPGFVDALVERDGGSTDRLEFLRALADHCRRSRGCCVFVIVDRPHDTVASTTKDDEDGGVNPLELVQGLLTGTGNTSCLIFTGCDDAGGRPFADRLRHHLLLQKQKQQQQQHPPQCSQRSPHQQQQHETGSRRSSSWRRLVDLLHRPVRQARRSIARRSRRGDQRVAVIVDANEKLMSATTTAERY